jgi:2'-5' RNA ligase
MDSLRTFIAVELDKQIIEELTRALNLLKETQGDVKWVTPPNAHITLKFLGSVDEQKIDKINKVIQESVSAYRPFSLTMQSLGAFPTLSSPKVIWIGALSEENNLEKLTQTLETKLVSLHFPKEKRDFKSHITIGRVRSNKNKAGLINLLQTLEIAKKEMLVKTVTLFKSTLSPKGSIYERLSVASLK